MLEKISKRKEPGRIAWCNSDSRCVLSAACVGLLLSLRMTRLFEILCKGGIAYGQAIYRT